MKCCTVYFEKAMAICESGLFERLHKIGYFPHILGFCAGMMLGIFLC